MMLDHFQRSRNAFSRITKRDFLRTTTTSLYGQKMQTRGLGIFSLELRSKTTHTASVADDVRPIRQTISDPANIKK